MNNITSLPTAFIRKPAFRLKSKRRVASPYRMLPFVGKGQTKAAPYDWNLPATGGYCGGCIAGEAMAKCYLKFMREDTSDMAGWTLTQIVEAFMNRFEQEGGQKMSDTYPANKQSDSYAAFRGQTVGFFNSLGAYLVEAARQLGGKLDAVSEDEEIAKANCGLAFDEKAYIASLADDDEEVEVAA